MRKVQPMRYGTTWAMCLAATAMSAPAVAQERPGPLTLTTHAIKGGAYWVEGGRSNEGFVVGDKGVVAIDTEMTPDGARKEFAEIAKVTAKPINAVIITHADPDHVGGLAAYPADARILMHENTRSEVVVSAADPHAPPMYTAIYHGLLQRLPVQTIGATQTVVLDGVRMVLMYTGPAHTSGDLMVYLPAQKIVCAGDVITTNTGRFPIIHLGGSSLGWIAAMKAILALNADVCVGGHGAIETRPQLQGRLRDAEERRDQIKAMVNANKSLAEIEQALPEQPVNPMFHTFTQTTYNELANGYPSASPPWTNIVRK